MIASLDLQCPYCANSVHAYDTDTGDLYLDPDSRPDAKPCEHLVFGKYHLWSDPDLESSRPRFSDHFEIICLQLRDLIEKNSDFFEWMTVMLLECVEDLSREVSLPLTPHKITGSDVTFLGNRRLYGDEFLDVEEGEQAEINNPWKRGANSIVPQDVPVTISSSVLWSQEASKFVSELYSAYHGLEDSLPDD
jgi:hypothetical protein